MNRAPKQRGNKGHNIIILCMYVYEIMMYYFCCHKSNYCYLFLKKGYSSVLCSSESFVDCSVAVSFCEFSSSTCTPPAVFSASVGAFFLSLASGFVVDELFFGLEDDC